MDDERPVAREPICGAPRPGGAPKASNTPATSRAATLPIDTSAARTAAKRAVSAGALRAEVMTITDVAPNRTQA
jgi:hypothetical protein